MAEKKPKGKPIEKYYAPYLNYTFDYPAVDEDGKALVRLNPHTGQPLYDSMGRVKPIHKSEKFQVLNNIYSKGYLSMATFNPNTIDKQEIARGEALRALAEARDIKVYYEDDYIKMTNPKQFSEIQARKALEAENIALKNQLEEKEFTISELEEKVATIEKKK